MIFAHQKNLLGTKFNILDCEGQDLLQIKLSGMSMSTQFEWELDSFSTDSSGVFKRSFSMLKNEQSLAFADSQDTLGGTIRLELDGRPLLMQAQAGIRLYNIFFETELIGNIFLSPENQKLYVVQLPKDWPVPIKIFLFWVSLNSWMHLDSSSM